MAVFNRDDGQLALGSKTPVSILQEILQKKGLTPQYELIYNGTGTLNPLFKFQVSAEGFTAVGDGKNKKEAKHDAAATLLKRLLNPVETDAVEPKEEVDIASPYTGALKSNFVGTLDEICFVNKIPIPTYVLVGEDGPPHARVFTMRCNLASIHEIAVARTKKQAKHLVAFKMIERVQKVLKDKFITPVENEDSEEVIRDQEKIRNGSFIHDISQRVLDLHNVFHIKEEEYSLPTVFMDLSKKPEDYYESMENPYEFLKEVVEALEGAVKQEDVTKAEIEASLRDLMLYFDEESENEESYCDDENEPSISNDVNIDSFLPDFLLSDDDDEEEEADRSFLPQKICEEVRKADVVELTYQMSDLKTSEVLGFSCIKVEVPMGFYTFVGEGGSDEEALNQAARRALVFLRLMSAPPLENSPEKS